MFSGQSNHQRATAGRMLIDNGAKCGRYGSRFVPTPVTFLGRVEGADVTCTASDALEPILDQRYSAQTAKYHADYAYDRTLQRIRVWSRFD